MADLLSVPEVAALLGVSRWAVWQLVKAERLPAERVGRDWVITRAALETFRQGYRPRQKRPRPAP